MDITVNLDTPDASGVPDGWALEHGTEGGQPNGAGDLEPSDAREWFKPERETHHRHVITLYGPWEPGPTPWALKLQESARRAREVALRNQEERTLRDAAEILQRRARQEMTEATEQPT